MASKLSPRGRRSRKVLGGTVLFALLATLMATLAPTASAISNPGIPDSDWNADFDGDWPPTGDSDWPVPATNPNIVPRCGIDIGVVIDRSGSIADAGQGANYKAGVNALIDAFAGTPSKMGLWSFANVASDSDATTYPWHQMADLSVAANVTSLKDTVDDIPIQSGFSTNWEEGLAAPLTAPVAAAPLPEMWIVITDGNPTVHADDDNSGGSTDNDDMAGGIVSANALKAVDVSPGSGPVGTKVFGVAVGPGINEDGISLISGPTAYNGSNFATADYLTSSFADLESALEDFALSLCGAKVTVTKQTSTMANPGTYAPASGWTFGADNPDDNPEPTPASGQTNGSGEVEFTVKSTGTETLTITETQQPGYELVSVDCDEGQVSKQGNSVTVSVDQGDDIDCLFKNRPVFIDLSVAKTDGKASTAPGATNDYTISYGNAADATATATDVVLTETVPANTTYEATGSDAWSCPDESAAGTVCTLDVGDLAPGANGSVQFVVEVINPVGAGVNDITNTVTVTGTGTERDTGDQTATDVDTLTAAPNLSVTKTDGDTGPVEPGELISYAITYANDGDEAATGVVLSETVPANTTFVAAGSAGWDCNGAGAGQGDGAAAGASCTYAVGGLAGGGAGGSAPFQVRVVNPVPNGVTSIANTVLIDDDICVGSCDSDDEDTPVDADPNVGVDKDADVDEVGSGGLITYTLDYFNDGDEGATGVVLTETVPANTTYVAAGSSAWSCVDGAAAGTVCTLAIGDLAGGASGSATFVVEVDDPLPAGVDQIDNVVVIDDDDESCTEDCDSDEETPVDAAPDLTVTKDDGGVTAEPGDEVTYTISYANVGDQDATGVVLVETVPENTTFVDDGPGGWECVEILGVTTCGYPIGDLAAGDSGEVDFTVSVDDPFPAGVTEVDNVVVVSDDGENGEDPTPENNTDDDQTPVDVPDVEPNEEQPPPTVGGEVIRPGVLPRTGSDVNLLLAAAGLLLILGGSTVFAAAGIRRRR